MPENTPRLAVVILTRNEAQNIADCIASVAFADEILVIDSGSTDGTQEIARAHGARVALHPFGDDGFAGQRNFALTQTQAAWVFYLDADERVTDELARELRDIAATDAPAVWSVQRINVLFGRAMHYGGHRSDWCQRLLPRTSASWTGKVHEGVASDLPARRLHGIMQHFTYTTWQQYFAKTNHYSSLAAQALHERGKTASGATVVSHACFAFVKSYVLKRGFLDGYYGFIMSVLAGVADLMKYLKLQNLCRLQAGKEG